MKLRALALTLILTLALVPTLTPRAERPDAPQYGKRGPFTVGTRDLVIEDAARPLTVTVWYPALNPDNKPEQITYRYGLISGPGRAILNAPPNTARGPYPLVVFSHGLGGARLQFVTYTEHLASHGFVVIAADHPGSTIDALLTGGRQSVLTSFALRPLEVLRQIAFAESLTAPAGPLAGAIDLSRIATTGHSFGGYTALSAAGARLNLTELQAYCAQNANDAQRCGLLDSAPDIARARGLNTVPDGLWPPTTDPRIEAVVALAPSSGPLFGKTGAAALEVPMMIIVGSKDRATVPEVDSYPVYEAASSEKKALVVLENAGHYIFVEQCPQVLIALGRFDQCSDLVWDMERAHDLTNHFAAAFLLAVLKDDAQAARALQPDAVKFVGISYRASGLQR